MDSLVRISKAELISKPHTGVHSGRTGMYSMTIGTRSMTENGLLLDQIIHLNNVISFSCSCLECDHGFAVKSSLQLHTDSHSKRPRAGENLREPIPTMPVQKRATGMEKEAGVFSEVDVNFTGVDVGTRQGQVVVDNATGARGTKNTRSPAITAAPTRRSAHQSGVIPGGDTGTVDHSSSKSEDVERGKDNEQIWTGMSTNCVDADDTGANICFATDRDEYVSDDCADHVGPDNNDTMDRESVFVIIKYNIDGQNEAANNDEQQPERTMTRRLQATEKELNNQSKIGADDVPTTYQDDFEEDSSSTTKENEHNSSSESEDKETDSKKRIKKKKKQRKGGDCTICEKYISGQQKFLEHMNVHTGEKPFVCSICERGFARKGELISHCRRHGDGDMFTCEVCGKTFTKQFALKQHSSIHTGEKPYPCSYCGRLFRLKGDVSMHMKIHTNTKSHLCSVCGKAFFKVSNLTEHARVHSGEKPHTCTTCSKSFALKGTLNDHMRMHENITYMCSFCGKEFKHAKSLKSHMDKKHPNALNYD